MTDAMRLGKAGENMVCRYVLQKGMKLLARNYRAGKGEVDLIALDGGKDSLQYEFRDGCRGSWIPQAANIDSDRTTLHCGAPAL